MVTPTPAPTLDLASDGRRPHDTRSARTREQRLARVQTKLISDIALAAAGEHDLEKILAQTLRRLGRHIPFTGGSIALVDGDELVVRAAVGPFATQALGERLARGRGESWRVIATKEPSLVNDVRVDRLVSRRSGGGRTIRSWLAVPLVRRNHGIGLLEVDSVIPGAFEDVDLSLLRTVATVLSGPVELASRYAAEVRALEEARDAQRRLGLLNEALNARAKQQAAVARLGQAALEASVLSKLLKQAVDLVARTLKVRYAAVLEYVPREQAFRLAAATGWGRGVVGRLHVRAGATSQPGYTLLRGEPVIVEDAADERRFTLERELLERGVVSSMSVPIQGAPEPYGVLVTHSELGRRFTRDDISFMVAISNILAAPAERSRAEEAERKVAELRDAFVGVISHELRTPITTIYGSAKILRHPKTRLSKAIRDEAIADIEAEAERLYRLVEDLLVLSRAEGGRLDVGDEPVLLHHLLPRVVASERQRHPSLRFELTMPHRLQAVAGEETYIEQVVRNLLGNAVKYGPSDAPIDVIAEDRDREVQIQVLDRGPGIQPDEAVTMFELFYRSKHTASQAGGVGIGLFVCRQLVEAMGGRIWSRPRPEGGAEFGFTLPAYRLVDDVDEEL